MCSAEERVRNHVVIALAHLCSPPDHETVFIHNEGNKRSIKFCFLISHSLYSECIFKQDAAKSSGLELLLNILQSQCTIQKRKASMALSMLASRANFISSLIQTISPSPTSQVFFHSLCVSLPRLFTLICFPYSLNHLSYPIVFEIELFLLPSQ